MTKTANGNSEQGQPIKELVEKLDVETVSPREPAKKNGRTRKKTGRPTQLSQPPIPWRRRNDTNALRGLAQEHSRWLARMHAGKVSLEAGEAISRTYLRQKELVSALEYTEYLRSIDERLKQMQDEQRMRTVSVLDYNAMAAEPPK
jgi:hypothetical protein